MKGNKISFKVKNIVTLVFTLSMINLKLSLRMSSYNMNKKIITIK